MIARRIRVTGRVQGVGYRAFVEARAQALGLDGWVRNRADGSVEALAVGAADAVDALIAACGQGPAAARVADVRVEEAAGLTGQGFVVKPTV